MIWLSRKALNICLKTIPIEARQYRHRCGGKRIGRKPRPALIVQSDRFHSLPTVLVALFTSVTSDVPDVRPRFEPDDGNGLLKPSDLMVDILVTVRLDQVGPVIGHLTPDDLIRAKDALLLILGFEA